jgi:zinc protease
LPSLSISYLDNGIPVIIKKNEANRTLTIKTILLGHVSLTPKEKAGLEAVTLTMLVRGSQKYSYENVKRILFEKSSTISPFFQSFDMTSFDLITIDKYFDELFPIYADAFLHPRWNHEEFPRVMNDFKMSKQEAENDAYSRTVIKLHEKLFEGHPYAASWEGVGNSLESITLNDVTKYYESTFSSGRIFIVAVGNFDTKTLLAKLNSSFGMLPKKKFTLPDVPLFSGKIKSNLLLESFEESKDLAYVRGDYALPPQGNTDYPALMVTFNLLNDILFEIIRTQNGACYSVWAGTHGFKANYGNITVYKTAVPGKVKHYIDDSIAVLLRGQCLAGKVSASSEGKGGIGKDVPISEQRDTFVPIAEALPFYKIQSITHYYSGQQTNSSIAAQIASSVVYRNDFRDYLLLSDRINAVTPEDIIRVTKKYLTNNPTFWIVLGSSGILRDVRRDDYLTP